MDRVGGARVREPGLSRRMVRHRQEVLYHTVLPQTDRQTGRMVDTTLGESLQGAVSCGQGMGQVHIDTV